MFFSPSLDHTVFGFLEYILKALFGPGIYVVLYFYPKCLDVKEWYGYGFNTKQLQVILMSGDKSL